MSRPSGLLRIAMENGSLIGDEKDDLPLQKCSSLADPEIPTYIHIYIYIYIQLLSTVTTIV